MLQIKNLTITHLKDLRTILKDFTFSLNKGDKVVIVGEEGNGKSTLMKLIYDEHLVKDYVEYTGEIQKNNTCLGYLAQELSQKEKEQSVYAFCSEVSSFYDLSPRDLSDIAHQLGLSVDLFYSDQMVGTLSGGEKVKLQLARLLILKPDTLLLDEPSNDIDIDTLEWLEQFINTCDLPIMFISHDETLIEKTANTVIHIEQIRRKTMPMHTIARMPYRQYFEERLAKLSHQEQVARKEQSDYEKQQAKLMQIQAKVEHRLNSISRADAAGGRLLKKKMNSLKSMEKRFEKEHEDMTKVPDVEEAIMISFDDTIELPNGKTVIDLELGTLKMEDRILAENIRLHVIGGEKICITGSNGVGKSTLLNTIARELLVRKDLKAAYMPQNYEDMLDLNLTPVDYLSATGYKEETTKIRTYLGSMKYTADEMAHEISHLSGGQKAKILFLKMILDQYNVLILDEPTRNFSPLSNPVIRNILKAYKGAIISISHDRKYISEVCDKVYRLTPGGLQTL
ncbi:MAG: ATP-binding cassette domain-containing protein [Clostridia bacterium]|nr:ATP-binding cassette domain-containing protein [Clostridia bacterium]